MWGVGGVSQTMTQYDRGVGGGPEEVKIVWRNKWTAPYAYGILTTQTDNQSFQEVTKNKINSFYIYFTSKDRTNQDWLCCYEDNFIVKTQP